MSTSTPAINAAAITETALTINDSWWNLFLERTNNFTTTTVMKNALAGFECAELKEMVVKAITEICRVKTNKYGFRVYVDGKGLKGSELEKDIFPQPPMPGEDIESWGGRLYPGKKFGMIINTGEKFCNELAQRLSVYTAPLLQKIGIPMNGLHSTIFIGNYGLTPLGIHQDHVGANVIHFHLGPGEKTMYTWSEEQYKELLAGRNAKDVLVEELLPHANSFPFGAGDVYFMSWDQFHIGYAHEFSIGVTVWFDNHIRKQVLDNLMNSFRIQYLNMEDGTVTVPEKDLENLHGYAEVATMFKIEPHLAAKTFPDFLKMVYEEYMLSLFSNQGWSSRPLSLSQESNYDENNYAYLADRSVKVTRPFRILYKHFPDINKVQIFVRGSKIEFNYHQEIVELIDKLNEGELYDVASLTRQVFKQLPVEVALYILSLLVNNRGVDVV
jgi:hypothetical protein